MLKCDACGKTIFDDSRRYREQLKKVRASFNNDKVCFCYDCVKKYNREFMIRLQQSLARSMFDEIIEPKYIRRY